MNIKGKNGSKDRLFEMMQGVTRENIHENSWQENLNNTLETAFEKLKTDALTMKQGGSYTSKIQSTDDTSYIGINGYDSEGNMYNFNFRIEATEGDQEGVGYVNDVILEKFYYQNPQGEKVYDVNEDDLKQFNQQHGAKLYDVIEKYIDSNELDENINKKEDSQPYGGSKQKYQDGMGYGDEKPVNSKLRTKAPELEKFVKEDEPKKWGEGGKFKDFDGVMKFVKEENDENPCWDGYEMVGMKEKDGKQVPNCVPQNNENEEIEGSGENIIKRNFKQLLSDIEFGKMAQAYENLLKMKKNEFRTKQSTQTALSSLRDLISEYLREMKGLNVTQEDVQNFFENYLQKFSSVVSENDEENGENIPAEEVPALDVNDVDNDGDKLEGGYGDNESVMDFDPEQILKGIEVEMEHTKDPKLALEIAIDHLEELPDYYTRLNKMEKQGKEDLQDLDDECELDSIKSSEIDNDDSISNIESMSNSVLDKDLKKYAEDVEDADKELKDTMLGYGTETPNIMEEFDYAAHEREYEDKHAYKRFQELDSKPIESLTDEEKEEYYNLWLEFGEENE
jgi:hypothetical protein